MVDDAVLQARAYKNPAVSPKPHLQKLTLDGIRASAKRRALSTLRPVKPMDNANTIALVMTIMFATTS